MYQTKSKALGSSFGILFVALLLMNPALLAAKDSREEDAKGFVESAAEGVYALAWPSATFKKASIKNSTRVAGGYDVSVRLAGESAFGGDLWVDIVFLIRGGGLKDIRVGKNNAVLFQPFETTKALGALVQEMFAEYQRSNAVTSRGTLGAVPQAGAGAEVGAVCIINPTKYKLNYSYSWGEGEWASASIESGATRWYWWNYGSGGKSSPKFNIRYDGSLAEGYTETRYWLERYAISKPVTCDKARKYEFFLKGREIDLRPLS